MKGFRPLIITLLVLPTVGAAETLPTEAELRSLFVVENPPLTNEFGLLLIRNQFDVAPLIACDLRKAHPNALILTDREGGPVLDMTQMETPLAPRDATAMNPEAFTIQVRKAGEALASARVDIDLAPVAETNSDKRQHSYSRNPQQAAIIAARFARTMTSAGVTPCLTTTLASWRAVRPSCCCPASNCENLDRVYVQNLRAAGFTGLVITDALWEVSNRPEGVVQALKSADVVLLPSTRQVNEALPVILAALRVGELNAANMRAKLHRVGQLRAEFIAKRPALLMDALH